MNSMKAREGQWYADRGTHDVFCVIAIDESDGLIDVRDRYGDIDEFDLDEWDAMDLELCAAPEEWGFVDFTEEWNVSAGEIEADEPEDSQDGAQSARPASAKQSDVLHYHRKSSGTT
jgi:hypothetical protein